MIRFRSLTQRIWLMMMIIFIVFTVLAGIGNLFVVANMRHDFIIDQLKEAAEEKLENDGEYHAPNDGIIQHFVVDFSNKSPHVRMDTLSKLKYGQASMRPLVNDVITSIDPNLDENVDSLHFKGVEYIYYTVNLGSGEHMVFITDVVNKTIDILDVISFFVIVFIGSYLIAWIIARAITKPVKQLSIFASEIAKGNWYAELPKLHSDEIGDLGQALDKMREDLHLAQSKEREFLQSASHDLKTPIMIIKGYAQSSIDGMLLSSDKTAAQTILDESERLDHRVKQLLDYSTLDQMLDHNTERTTIRLDRLLKGITRKFEGLSNHLSWESQMSDVEFNGNIDAMRICFENILHNQLRYAKSKILITLKESDAIYITISNDGPAISEAMVDTLFDNYKKSKDGNHGIGLAIVKKVINSHGGTVRAENTTSGVVFTIVLEKVTL